MKEDAPVVASKKEDVKKLDQKQIDEEKKKRIDAKH